MEGLLLLIFLIGVVFFSLKEARNLQHKQIPEKDMPHFRLYRGKALRFTDWEINEVCEKYNPYYKALPANKKIIFLKRLKAFMKTKDFYINGPGLFKEMPILISAAAIQISFGLQNFMFPYFSNIVIYPEEYIGYDPLRILIGNVQGQSINLSWKHFLDDYKNPHDGKNVGLHEMAHALQVQYLFKNYGFRSDFKTDYEHYDKVDDEVLHAERLNSTSFFDNSALNNPNEFWATCVELFFEKPNELYRLYPRLYLSISMVLNQDPCDGNLFR